MSNVFWYTIYWALYILTTLKLFAMFVVLLLIFTMLIATITLIERKVMSLTQRRVGPNYIGYKGRLQFIADAVKLLVKHILIISKVNKFLFILVPAMLLFWVYLFWANIVWAPNLAIIEIEYNLLFMGIMSSFFSYFLILVGYNSNNKYAIMSSSRVIIMSFTLEIFLTFFFVLLGFISSSFSISSLAENCATIYRVVVFVPIFPVLLIALLLETNRIPFDLAEAESELIAGYTTEYGGFFFVLFYLGEYFHLFTFCAFYTLILFNNFIIMFTSLFNLIYLMNNSSFLLFCYLNSFEFLFLFLFVVLNYCFLYVNSYRYKLLFFIFNILWLSVGGASLSLDGFVFLLLITELSLMMLFLILFLSATFSEEKINKNYFLLFLNIAVFFYLYLFKNTTFINFAYLHDTLYIFVSDLLAKDLILIYMFTLYLNFYVVIYVSCILGLFSFFFIFIFYTFKQYSRRKKSNKEYSFSFSFLRYQRMFKQRKYQPHIRLFQK